MSNYNIDDAIHDLTVIKDFFEERSNATPICIEFAIDALGKSKTEPAIDIVPKRGEWQYICSGKWMFRRCSCCEWTQTYDDSKYMGYRYNFCPNCGAKMDGERRE